MEWWRVWAFVLVGGQLNWGRSDIHTKIQMYLFQLKRFITLRIFPRLCARGIGSSRCMAAGQALSQSITT